MLIVSDMHVGSAFAPFPEGFTLSTGSVLDLNVGQRYLLTCWQDMLGRAKFDYLIFNGDIIDGQNKKLEARYRVEVDPQWQVSAALELARSLAQTATGIYVTKGTDYHVREAAQDDESFGQRIGAIPDPLGHHAWDWLLLDIEGVFLDIAHHRSSVLRYESMPLEREEQFDLLTADLKEGGASDVIIRSHGHRYVVVNADGRLSVSTPAWCLQTSYAARSRWPNRWLSRLIGSVQLDIYPKLKTGDPRQDRGEFIEVKSLTYPHPKKGRRRVER